MMKARKERECRDVFSDYLTLCQRFGECFAYGCILYVQCMVCAMHCAAHASVLVRWWFIPDLERAASLLSSPHASATITLLLPSPFKEVMLEYGERGPLRLE